MATRRLGCINILKINVARKHTLSGDEYQFLQRSQIPTYHFQKSLRRLSIPKLEDSCQRLLAAAKPILPDDRYKALEAVTRDFQCHNGPGKQTLILKCLCCYFIMFVELLELQKELIKYDKLHKDTSYISEAWFDIYLKSRTPCPINFNPFMSFAPDPEKSYNDQLARSTNLAISFGRIKRSLDSNLLEPEVFHMDPKKSKTKLFQKVCSMLPSTLSWYGAAVFKAFPLDMSQYKSLFGCSRIPQKGRDFLHHCSNAKHFLAIHKGKFYSVELFDENGYLALPNQIKACVAAILADSEPANQDECIGSLTTLERDQWAEVRLKLSSLASNAASLSVIDDALFAICLDTLDDVDPKKQMESLLTGGDGSNRWFDKCFQLIVDSQGVATINFEHSWGDGVAVLRLMEESYHDSIKNHFVAPDESVDQSIDVSRYLKRIHFTFSDDLKLAISKAQKAHQNVASQLHYGVAAYENLNKELIKKSKLSPDALMQLAIQLAYYKVYREFVPTYESCSTAAFLKGRTECVRSATEATKDAVLAIMNSSYGHYESLVAASNRHSQLVKEACLGQGFDRHLLGLRITAERLALKQAPLFSSEEFNYMNQFILSTSTLSTETISFGGFGPVLKNGFGIGYTVSDRRTGAAVTSYKAERNAEDFCNMLVESLDTLYAILRKHFN